MRSVLGLAGAAFLVYSAVRLRVSLPPMFSSVLQSCVRCVQSCVHDATRRWGQEAAEQQATAADGLPPQVHTAGSSLLWICCCLTFGKRPSHFGGRKKDFLFLCNAELLYVLCGH